ncbi:preprotein translocase subunit SecE [Anoxybacter fermentans]|uniref:Protein translocase subunit SecE n=1 Tax=Anoxybacter fermentans TaxID=1323375 RepID=A0A3S9T2E6_9FIRM|nr:preprotein translocase subunit SecE [Anoxybacter fermentans]AZR74705.1 preprotein translocase subunit SecE [Anoxybacter fermentans]
MASKGLLARIKKYFREVRAELRKVNWPNFKELASYTTVVLVTVFIVAVFIGVVDLIFSNLIAPLIIR